MDWRTKFDSLKSRIEARNRIITETGHYWGIDKFALLDEDPVKFNRFNARLISAVMAAREIGKYVAASPAATGMGELVFGLLTVEGDCMAASTGLVGHSATMPVVLESFCELGYDVNPGTKHGDIWECNDPYYGAPHAADCFTWVPIIYKGTLVGWGGGVNHIGEVGGMVPGAVPPIAPNVFVEGYDYTVTRSGENDTFYPWWEDAWKRRTRAGEMNILDNKMRFAGCGMIRDRVLEICEEFGVEYTIQCMYEILEWERATMEKRLQKWVMPGKYKVPFLQPVKYKGKLGMLIPEANKNWLLHWPLVFTLGNGRATYDFSGASNQDWHHYNMYMGGLRFGINLAWYPVFLIGENMHTANIYLMDFIRPPGSVANPTNPFVGTPSSAVMGCRNGQGAMMRALSKALWGRGYVEETFVFEASDYNMYGMSGTFSNGVPWGMSNFSLVGAQHSGARAFMDGGVCDASGQNPETDYGESEDWETIEPPLLNIIRGVTTDYCVHGKYRGGIGYTLAFMVNEPGQFFQVNDSCSMNAEVTTHCIGPSGSYPGQGHAQVYIKKTNMPELIKKGEYPGSFREIKQWIKDGKLTCEEYIINQGEAPPRQLEHGDIYCILAHSVEGWGDPVDRDLYRIEEDLNFDYISPEIAKRIYSAEVVTSDGIYEIEPEATAKARQEILKEREKNSVSAIEWWKEEREKILKKEVGDEEVHVLFEQAIANEKWGNYFREFWGLDKDYSF
ncbi:MAG: hydantoinase B/oxoprolinase family protein [Syntrophales bacterium]